MTGINTSGANGVKMKRLTRMISVLQGKGWMTMPDREKVIKETENGIAFAESRGFGGLANTMRDALALLKEQDVGRIPEEVNRDRTCEVYPGEWVRKGSCPYCDKVVHWFTNRKYCGFCGKAVKWE